MTTALDGLRILEIGSGPAAAFAGMVLAENGAEVVKVERPAGSRDRARPGHVVWHRGKKSVTLDLESADGRSALDDVLAGADAVVIALSPATRGRLGLDGDALHARFPALVVATIDGWGPGGPLSHLPGTDGVLAAATGRMATTNGYRPGPIFTPVPIASFGAAMLTVEAVLAALLEVRRSGHGQHVGTSLLQALSTYDMTSGHGNRTSTPPAPGKVFGVMHVPFMTAPTADGRFIQMCSRQKRHFENWMQALELDELLTAPDLPHIPDLFPSEERLDEVVDLVRERMRSRTADDWMALFATRDIGADPFLTAPEYLVSPQCLANDRSKTVVDPAVGVTRQVGPLAAMSETPSVIGAPAPALGAHTDEVLASAVTRSRPAPTEPTASPVARRPLEGITIVECGYFYATPFASTLLAEAGARVLKVEPNAGDPGRRNWTTPYVKAMVGKESITLDLKTDEGRAIMHELVDRADVFLHNFRPGTPERLGIGYDELIGRNPRLVYVYGSCFGSSGPWAKKAGFHSSPNAISGAGFIEAGDGNPPINRTYADPASALATTAAIMVGLHARERTGRGQYIETVMLTSMAYAVSEWGVTYDGKVDRLVDGGQHGFGDHERLYATSDGWVYVECTDPAGRAAFDARTGTSTAAREAAVRGWSTTEALAVLDAAGVVAVRADGLEHGAFMLTSAQCRAVGVSVETEQAGVGRFWRAGPALRFGAAAVPLAPSPDNGEQTTAILAELGHPDTEIRELLDRGVTRPVGNGLPT
jgi:crotonobetainyl-CoA:carnitine CoA-transferase CaiB-like acyl-CoA transferase